MEQGRVVVYVTPELIADWLKHGSSETRVVADAIPADAELEYAEYSAERRAFALTFKHPSFPPGESIREPLFERVIR